MSERGHFFLVDVPTFDAVCDLGDPDAAAAYLILAAGTGPDNLTSSWGRDAIAKRTSLNWRHADTCTAKLEEHGFLRWIEKSTRKTRLALPRIENRYPLTPRRAAIVSKIAGGGQPENSQELAAAREAKNLGWLDVNAEDTWRSVDLRPMQPAYLPLSLVGDAKGRVIEGTSIIERIRKARDAMAFHLLVNFYAMQDLADGGGVDRALFRCEFKRDTVTRTGRLQIWKFASKGSSVFWHPVSRAHAPNNEPGWGAPFFNRFAILEDAGAVEWAYYLAEDDRPTSVLICPVGVSRHGRLAEGEPESVIGVYATHAACAVSDQPELADEWVRCAPAHFILPVDRLAREVVLVGVPRMRGHSLTANTRRWASERADSFREWIAFFRGIIAEHAPDMIEQLDRRFADFNSTSTLPQLDLKSTSTRLP